MSNFFFASSILLSLAMVQVLEVEELTLDDIMTVLPEDLCSRRELVQLEYRVLDSVQNRVRLVTVWDLVTFLLECMR